MLRLEIDVTSDPGFVRRFVKDFTVERIVSTLLSLLAERGVDVIALYGFGSFFSGVTHPESDLDIAFLAKEAVLPEQRWEIQEALARSLKKNVDLVDLSRASLVMKMQIISTGVRLYCKDETFCGRFETYIYSAYCRFNEERKQIIRDIVEGGRVYGR